MRQTLLAAIVFPLVCFVPAESPAAIVTDVTALISESCVPTNGAIDPGETVTVQFFLKNTGPGNTTNLVATLLPSASITPLSGPQTYGVLLGGGAAVGQSFALRPNGACGSTVPAAFQLQDGAADLGTVSFSLPLGSITAGTNSFTNSSLITINDAAPATPYPSTIAISGFAGNVTKVTASVNGISHTYPADVDILLVSPGGQKVMLMSSAGSGFDIVNVNLTFDDSAAQIIPAGSQISSGTFRPANYSSSAFNLPSNAPAGPYLTNLSAFNGINPNGTWQLFVNDHAGADFGTIGNWSLTIAASNVTCCLGSTLTDLAASMTASPDPVVVSNNVTYTFTVQNRGPAAASGVVVTNPLPTGADFVSASTSQGSTTNTGSAVVANLGPLSANASATVSLVVRANGTTGAIANSASVSANEVDYDGSNNSATALTAVVVFNIWTNSNGGVWNAGGNWTPAAPSSGSNTLIQFNATGGASYAASNNFAGTFLVNRLSLNSSSSNRIFITGNALQFSAGAYGSPLLSQDNSGAVAISNNIALGATTTLGGDGSGLVALAGVISGSNDLVKTGNSTIELTGVNTFGGTGRSVSVNRGTLAISATANLGSGNNTVNINSNATLQIS
ncbi:MAG TPA: proprotein convertase P-domain-containing protein, partial [Verrucomicrobiae bacterium]